MIDPLKYARIERERRFLVREVPQATPTAIRCILDRYVTGTRLRLRHIEGVVDGEQETVYKLTQKVPSEEPDALTGRQGSITNTYLTAQEFDVLCRLPARTLNKTRLSLPPFVIDRFENALLGLLLAEVEFDTDVEMTAFVAPGWCGREVTSDRRYTGGNFVRLLDAPVADVAHEINALLEARWL